MIDSDKEILEAFIELVHALNAEEHDGTGFFAPSPTFIACEMASFYRDLEDDSLVCPSHIQDYSKSGQSILSRVGHIISYIERECPFYMDWKLCEVRGMTQTALAKCRGISQPAIHKRVRIANEFIVLTLKEMKDEFEFYP